VATGNNQDIDGIATSDTWGYQTGEKEIYIPYQMKAIAKTAPGATSEFTFALEDDGTATSLTATITNSVNPAYGGCGYEVIAAQSNIRCKATESGIGSDPQNVLVEAICLKLVG